MATLLLFDPLSQYIKTLFFAHLVSPFSAGFDFAFSAHLSETIHYKSFSTPEIDALISHFLFWILLNQTLFSYLFSSKFQDFCSASRLNFYHSESFQHERMNQRDAY